MARAAAQENAENVSKPDDPPRATCQACDEPAIVHVSDIVDGDVIVRHFCSNCVDSFAAPRESPAKKWGQATTLITFGTAFLVMSLLADQLAFGGWEGFGIYQWTGALVGIAMVLTGAVARARALFLIGMVAATLSLVADYFSLGTSEGFGAQQILGCVLGAVAIALGVKTLLSEPSR
jgi:hypothetical protein